MVLKGKNEGFSIPFDAPLYSLSADEVIEYRNCEVLCGVFETVKDVEAILPEGLEFFSDPPQAAYWLSWYGDSTVGPYYEYISMIMVQDEEGDFGYYIPYIYVTNDAALAAGRELAGAPKKLAHMNIARDFDFLQGTLERPAGKRLTTITFNLQSRASGDIVESYLPEKTFLYSIRHLPPIKGKGGVTQLIKWYASIDIHKDPRDRKAAWTGPVTVTYDSPSNQDPVHKLKVENIIAALYLQFDMALGVEKILRTY
jgi:acetoacetate decarboxylase